MSTGPERYAFTASPEDAGSRLDLFLVSRLPDFTRAYVQARIDAGDVRVDGRDRKASFRLRGGETITVTVHPVPSATALVPEPMPLAILYEDADVIVIDKPAGLVVHPGAGNWTGTLVHGILAHAPDVRTNDEMRPGIVHRLDKETSGVLIVARNDARAGVPRPPTARPHGRKSAIRRSSTATSSRDLTVDAPIARDPQQRTRMAVVSTGRPATSVLHVVERLPGYTLLDVDLHTGRTHQIRVHCAHIGHPVAGDSALRRAARAAARPDAAVPARRQPDDRAAEWDAPDFREPAAR